MFELTILGLFLSCAIATGAKSLAGFSTRRFQEFFEFRTDKTFASIIKKNHRRTATAVSVALGFLIFLTIFCAFLFFLGANSEQWQEKSFLFKNVPPLALVVFALIALVVWVPAMLAKRWGPAIVYWCWPIWRFLTVCLYPIELATKLFYRNSAHFSDCELDCAQKEQLSEPFSNEFATIATEEQHFAETIGGGMVGIAEQCGPEIEDGIKELDDDAYQVSGNVRINELNDRLGIGFPEDSSYDTIADFLLNRMGRVPTQGEAYDFDGLRMTVISGTRQEIELIRLEALPEDAENMASDPLENDNECL
jgi:Hemolysins and related proteins containing CBS domains